ncbi:hypothetical protein NA78x_000326 [Anatilimnocola sp. NA78]|uniref:hypothetical protein n=1 Tax=Anatilimnocola sp. NA78 TaxID=3415683 RepID=UPI003CE4B5EC
MRLKPGPQQQERRVTVAEVEADYFASLKIKRSECEERRTQLKKPLGYCNGDWEKLKAMIQPDDELWEVCSDKESWSQGMGSQYLDLRRSGESITHIVLRMN